jgi:hypothetical protein
LDRHDHLATSSLRSAAASSSHAHRSRQPQPQQPDANRSAPSKLMSSGGHSRPTSTSSSRRSGPAASNSAAKRSDAAQHGGGRLTLTSRAGPSPVVDSFRRRARSRSQSSAGRAKQQSPRSRNSKDKGVAVDRGGTTTVPAAASSRISNNQKITSRVEKHWAQVGKSNRYPLSQSDDDHSKEVAEVNGRSGGSMDDLNDLQARLLRLAEGRHRCAESTSTSAKPERFQQKHPTHPDSSHNSIGSVGAVGDTNDGAFSPRRTSNMPSHLGADLKSPDNINSFHSSNTTEDALGGSLHFEGEPFDHTANTCNEKHESNHRCVLIEDPFGWLDLDDETCDSEKIKTTDGWVRRNYEGGKAA